MSLLCLLDDGALRTSLMILVWRVCLWIQTVYVKVHITSGMCYIHMYYLVLTE